MSEGGVCWDYVPPLGGVKPTIQLRKSRQFKTRKSRRKTKSIDNISAEADKSRPKNQTDCLIQSWENNQTGIDSDNSQIGRSQLRAIFANKVNVPLGAIFVNNPILCMSINTSRANIMM